MNKDYLLELAKDEYFSLRAEVLASVERQYSIANWCISSIAILAAGILGGWNTLSKSTVFLPIFVSIAIPMLATSYIVTWTHVISKIHLLGKRLWQIEENIASAVGNDLIKSTFHINPNRTEINSFVYSLGWEHLMWTDGKNSKINTTIKIVKLSVLIFYFATTSTGLLISINNAPHQKSTSIIIFWLFYCFS